MQELEKIMDDNNIPKHEREIIKQEIKMEEAKLLRIM